MESKNRCSNCDHRVDCEKTKKRICKDYERTIEWLDLESDSSPEQ